MFSVLATFEKLTRLSTSPFVCYLRRNVETESVGRKLVHEKVHKVNHRQVKSVFRLVLEIDVERKIGVVFAARLAGTVRIVNNFYILLDFLKERQELLVIYQQDLSLVRPPSPSLRTTTVSQV